VIQIMLYNSYSMVHLDNINMKLWFSFQPFLLILLQLYPSLRYLKQGKKGQLFKSNKNLSGSENRTLV
jgi:hypothetical protein